MLEILHFVFSSFWIWLGSAVLVAVFRPFGGSIEIKTSKE